MIDPKTTTKEQKKQEGKTLLTEVKENTLTAKIRLGTMSMRARKNTLIWIITR